MCLPCFFGTGMFQELLEDCFFSLFFALFLCSSYVITHIISTVKSRVLIFSKKFTTGGQSSLLSSTDGNIHTSLLTSSAIVFLLSYIEYTHIAFDCCLILSKSHSWLLVVLLNGSFTFIFPSSHPTRTIK